MSRNDEPTQPAFVVAVARQVLDHHERGGTCQRCTALDCDQTVWALAEIAANHSRRALRRCQWPDCGGRTSSPAPADCPNATVEHVKC